MPTLRRVRSLLAGALFLTLGMVLTAPAASACQEIDIQTDEGDACATVLAVSVHGDARGSGDCNSGFVQCVAVSGTGNASNPAGEGTCGADDGDPGATPLVVCWSVSGTGDASNGDTRDWDEYAYGRCGGEALVTLACWSVSGTGDASYAGADHSCESVGACIVASAAGDTRAHADRCYGPGTCGTCVSPLDIQPYRCSAW